MTMRRHVHGPLFVSRITREIDIDLQWSLFLRKPTLELLPSGPCLGKHKSSDGLHLMALSLSFRAQHCQELFADTAMVLLPCKARFTAQFLTSEERKQCA